VLVSRLIGIPVGMALSSAGVDVNLARLIGLVVGVAPASLHQLWLGVSEGSSLGKRAEGIRIVRAADGGPPGIARLVLREWVAPGLPALFGVVGNLGFWLTEIAVLNSTSDGRTLRDYLAGTRVVAPPRQTPTTKISGAIQPLSPRS
jgi:uncharacterized RDD family membrane protein YckC